MGPLTRVPPQSPAPARAHPLSVTTTPLPTPRTQLNFRYCPLNYRMLSSGVVALGWNIFLSITANSAAASPASSAAADGSVEDVALR